MKTKVVFRKYKEGDILALFPDEIADPLGNCLSYQHVGQHGAATYEYCIEQTKPAKPEEYQELKRELEGRGYDLEVKKRKS
jgi:hypothetical protein